MVDTLVQNYAAKTGRTETESKEIVDGVLDAIVETIVNDPDGNARLAPLGGFRRRTVPERTYNNSFTQFQDVVKPEHVVVDFNAYKPLRDALNPDIASELLDLD